MYRIQHVTPSGQVLADRELASPEAIAARIAPDYLDDFQAACARLDADGETQTVWIGSYPSDHVVIGKPLPSPF